MESVPGAVATWSQLIARIENGYPVATAPGTDLILKLGHHGRVWCSLRDLEELC